MLIKRLKLYITLIFTCLAVWSRIYADAGFIRYTRCYGPTRTIAEDSISGFGFEGRLKAYLNNNLLIKDRDYRISSKDNKGKLLSLAFQPGPEDSLCLETQTSPLFPSPDIKLYSLNDVPILNNHDTNSARQVNRISQRFYPGPGDASAAPLYQLNYSGNKSIMVTMGEQGGINLEQSLQLDIDGRLSEKVYITGHLSDQEIPIQPEGNTATLREVDQIFVKIYGDGFSYILGDYMLNFGESNIDEVQAKVQGVQGHYARGPWIGKLSLSLSRGTYHNYTFKGIFGKQTGYYLEGKNNRQFITVLAGTEKIWQNGIRLIRGKHYQIEYGEGRVDFLNELIVTGEHLFTVEFQYTDKDYPRYLYSGEIADTAGFLKWSLRTIAERDIKSHPDAFTLSDKDIDYLETIGDDSLKSRTTGLAQSFDEENWEPGLYYVSPQSEAYYIYADSTHFDSLQQTGVTLHMVTFSPYPGGNYSQTPSGHYEYTPGSGSFHPGFNISLPKSRSHYALNLTLGSDSKVSRGHTSSATFMFSQLDKNLFSPKTDDDNNGHAFHYNGIQSIGKPINESGYSRVRLKYVNDYKSRDYESFKQVVESYAFHDTWNLPASLSYRDFFAHRVTLEDEPYTNTLVGAEYGKAMSGLKTNSQGQASAERIKGFTVLGNETKRASYYTEAKFSDLEAGEAETRKNYKTGISATYQLPLVTPEANYEQDEWLTNPSGNAGLMSFKKKYHGALIVPPLFNRLKTRTDVRYLSWESNFSGQATTYHDSLQSWELSQQIELFNLGVWQSEIFYSWQQYQERSEILSDYTENTFTLIEFNNRLQDYKKGYTFNTGYRINRTLDIPLIKRYEQVSEGTGSYSCEEITTSRGPSLNCIESETGNYIPMGLMRDTLSTGIFLQDLDWTGNLNLSPRRFPFKVTGILADLDFAFLFFLSYQDSSNTPGFLPLFTDRQIKEQLGGKSRFQPSLRWTSPDDRKIASLRYERKFSHIYSNPSFDEFHSHVQATFEHELALEYSYSLFQSFTLKEKSSEAVQLNEQTTSFTSGGDIEKKFQGHWLLKPIIDYSFTQGSIAEAEKLQLHTLFPRLRCEYAISLSGQAFLEYGIHSLWGDGNLNVYNRIGGFSRGYTHRLQAAVDYRIGQYIYCTGNYLLRFEQDTGDFFQKFTTEVRAVF
ncbi:MAG: hypothetical protein HQK83_11030 [Fibrobacteria bacterium]|nr:hypothetical protein [Fibrobacteria bacterium]